MVTGIMFQVDWVIDQPGFHTRIISKALKQKQLWARLSRAPTWSELLFITKNIYADESVYFFEPASFVV
jgi:hypothetical protein